MDDSADITDESAELNESGQADEPEELLEGALVERHEQPDVYLDVPTLKVDEIDLEVEDLRARVSLQAEVLDLLKLNVGVDVVLGRVKLDITGVEAQALLKVRLDNVAEIVGHVMRTIDRNPQILEQITQPLGSAVESVGAGTSEAVGELGRGAGSAAEDVGKGAGKAAEGLGEGAGKAAEGLGEDAGDVVGSAEGTVKQVGGGAEGAVKAVGESAESAVDDAGERAPETVTTTRGKGRKAKDEGGGAPQRRAGQRGRADTRSTAAARRHAPRKP
ncbi:hypothetical protein ACH492_16605 [Streptomyces sp. NPDC019443]|uniref:hypothetical protein n=1 Tax=Streptomyces sp. NPDC019443 TaxID=3365061 RepID=UPI00378B24B7